MPLFFARAVFLPSPLYVTQRSPNHKPYVQHPADPRAKTWQSRRAAQAWCDKRRIGSGPAVGTALFEVVEAPAFWRKRDPATIAEWNELAAFFHEASGAVLAEQVWLADTILADIIAEKPSS
jgi:hypothetical protein